jgi:hypothetical protein
MPSCIIKVYGNSENGEEHEEEVTVDASNRVEAIKIALSEVAQKFDSTWQFYADW